MKIIVFLTYNRSLENWKEDGTLDRELKYYSILSNKLNAEITFFSYASQDESFLLKNYNKLFVISIYSGIKRKKFNKFFYPFFYILTNKKKFEKFNFIKTNQNLGSWNAVFLKILFKEKILISRSGFDLYHFAKIKKKNVIKSYLINVLIYHFSNKIIITTDFYKKFISKNFFVTKKKIFVIPNFIDQKIFYKKNFKKLSSNVLFVGRFTKQKNLFELLDFFSNTNLDVDFVGDGDLKNELLMYSKKINCNLSFIDQKIDNFDLPNLYNNYQYFALFSNYEGNPKVLLEAMACGLICFVKNSVGINNIIQHKVNGYIVDSLNKDDLSNIFNNKYNERISKLAIEYIRENHNINLISDLESNLY